MIDEQLAYGGASPEGVLLMLLPFFFAVIVLGMIYFLTGWRQFYKNYPFNPHANPTDMLNWQSARIGLVNFNNAINFGFSQHGLYVKPVKLFSFGIFKPLLFPWHEIMWKKKQRLGFTIIEITPKKSGTSTIVISKALYEKMKPKLKGFANIKTPEENVF